MCYSISISHLPNAINELGVITALDWNASIIIKQLYYLDKVLKILASF